MARLAFRHHPATTRWVRLVHRWQRCLGIVAAVLAVCLWWAALSSRYSPNYDYSDTVGPALWLSGAFDLADGSIQSLIYPFLQSLLPPAAAALGGFTGASVESLHLIASASMFILGLGALAWLAARLAGTAWAGAAVIPLAAGSWLTALQIGYGFIFFHPNLLLGAWGFVLAAAVLSLWTVSDRTSVRMACFALAGLVFCIHSTYGLGLLAMIGLGELLNGLRERAVLSTFRRLLAGTALFAFAAMPQIVGFARLYLDAPPSAAGSADWWILMAFRKPFHVFLWDSWRVPAELTSLAVAVVAAMANLAWHTPAERMVRLLAVIAGAAMFCVVAYAAVEIVPTPVLAGLVLTRFALLVIFFLLAISAALPFLAFQRWRAKRGPLNALRVVLLAAAAVILALASTDTNMREIGMRAVYVGLLFVAAALPVLDRRRPLAAADRLIRRINLLPPAAMAFLAFSLIVLMPGKIIAEKAKMPGQPPADWGEVTEFLRERTPRDALVLMPPYPYSIASAQRSHLIDYANVGWSVYARWLVNHEYELLRLIYGVDLAAMSTPQDVRDFLASQDGVLCVFERGYMALVSDQKRIRELATRFPRLAYVVAPRPGTVPHEWACGPAQGRLLDLPAAFQNQSYIVYSLREE